MKLQAPKKIIALSLLNNYMKKTNTNPVVTGIERMLIAFFALSLFAGLTSCEEKTVATPTILPSAVNGLSVLGQDAKDTLTWSANFTDEKVNNYYVYAGTSESNLIKVGTTTNTGFLHVGLTNGTKYYYAVSAVNGKGEGPKSTIVNATPNLALNKQFTMFVPQVLPGALKAAPWRYYDPNEEFYSDNPFVVTDTFKYIINARIYEGFNTSMYEEVRLAQEIPSKYVLLNDYRLKGWNSLTYNKKIMQAFDRISIWSTGINGQSTWYYYKVLDTIPVSFYLQGDFTKTQITNILQSIRLVVDGDKSFFGKSYLDKTYATDQFSFYNQVGVWDKIKPSAYNTSKGWLFILPVSGSRAGISSNSQNTISGYAGMQIQVNYKDLTSDGKTIF